MRKSSNGWITGPIIVAALCLFALVFYQKTLLIAIQYMIQHGQPGGLPTSATSFPTLSFPKAPAPVSVGVESVINNLGITVTRVISPADYYVGSAGYKSLDKGEEYLVVDIKVRCVSSQEKCHVTEFDFGVQSKAGHDYPAELSMSYSDDLKGVFEGGDIEPGKSMSGSLIFIIKKGESGLTLYYPRLYSFGGTAKFILGK